MQFFNNSLLAVNKTLPSTSLSSLSLSVTAWMPPMQAAHIFGAIFIGCGVVALIFNVAIIITLCRLRRNTLSRVFYLLIFNFAIIDLLKSTCSVIWALKMLPVGISTSMYFMKADQFALMILRFANLATISNLLILTLNEYIYIIYPFHYRRLITTTRVTLLIAICWIVAWVFTLSILFVGSRKQSIYIKPDCLRKRKYLSSSHELAKTILIITTTTTATTTTAIATPTADIHYSLNLPSACFVRNSQISNNTEYVYNVSVIVFCFVCLFISIVCYGELIRFISKIVRSDPSARMDNGYQINRNVNGEFNRAKKQLLKRNKYVIVIGTVMAIYTVYLISYSAIKFLFVSRLKSSRLGIPRTAMYYLRWSFQTLMCLNTLLQPLCYFRMHEFRSAFKIVVLRQSKSLTAESICLSNVGCRRRIVLRSSSRSDEAI